MNLSVNKSKIEFLILLKSPDGIFTVGLEDFSDIYSQNITSAKLMGCSVLGLITQLILITFYEYSTSHGFAPVRNLSKLAENAPTLNIIYAYYLGYVS